MYSADNRYAALTDGDGHFEFMLPKQASEVVTGSVYSGLRGEHWRLQAIKFRRGSWRANLGFWICPIKSRNLPRTTISLFLFCRKALSRVEVAAAGSESAAGVMVQIFSPGSRRGAPTLASECNCSGEFGGRVSVRGAAPGLIQDCDAGMDGQ